MDQSSVPLRGVALRTLPKLASACLSSATSSRSPPCIPAFSKPQGEAGFPDHPPRVFMLPCCSLCLKCPCRSHSLGNPDFLLQPAAPTVFPIAGNGVPPFRPASNRGVPLLSSLSYPASPYLICHQVPLPLTLKQSKKLTISHLCGELAGLLWWPQHGSRCLCSFSPWSHPVIHKSEHVASLITSPSLASGFTQGESWCPRHGLEDLTQSGSP